MYSLIWEVSNVNFETQNLKMVSFVLSCSVGASLLRDVDLAQDAGGWRTLREGSSDKRHCRELSLHAPPSALVQPPLPLTSSRLCRGLPPALPPPPSPSSHLTAGLSPAAARVVFLKLQLGCTESFPQPPVVHSMKPSHLTRLEAPVIQASSPSQPLSASPAHMPPVFAPSGPSHTQCPSAWTVLPRVMWRQHLNFSELT